MGSQIVFVFSTRGGQWAGMGRELYEGTAVFREALRQCDRVIQQRLGWSLEDELLRPPEDYRLHCSEELLEPTLTAIQVGLCELWGFHGVRPDAVLGMSGGEFGAAFAAGALSAEDAMKVACSVSLVIRKRLGAGRMVWVKAGPAEIQELLRLAPRPLYVSAEVGPAFTILSTEEDTIQAALQFLAERGLRHGQIPSDFGLHSPLVDCWKTDFIRALDDLCVCPPHIPVYSSLVGGLVGNAMFDALHWWRVVREPALYARAVGAVLEDGYDRFLEIGPHPVVSVPIQDLAVILGKNVCLMPSMRRDQPSDLVIHQSLRSLGSVGDG